MKISIVNVQVPFVKGGAEFLAESLARRVRARGHTVEEIQIPFRHYPPGAILDHMLACSLMRLDAGDPDLVIAFKFPAYLCPAPRKKLWLLHQFRAVYDLWDTPYSGMTKTPENFAIRDMIRHADNAALGHVDKLFTNSHIVARRLWQGNAIKVDEVLFPPLDNPEQFSPGDFGDYFFYPSRICWPKRQLLAIEAMAHVKSPFRLVLGGKPDSDEFDRKVRETISTHNLHDKVQILGWLSEADKSKWMRDACGAIYIPFDEDSYGFVTLEAFHSHKPLVTCTDSGGTHEIVEDGRNGLISQPTPQALAEAMESLWNNKRRARDLGGEGFATLARHGIEWGHILSRFLD